MSAAWRESFGVAWGSAFGEAAVQIGGSVPIQAAGGSSRKRRRSSRIARSSTQIIGALYPVRPQVQMASTSYAGNVEEDPIPLLAAAFLN